MGTERSGIEGWEERSGIWREDVGIEDWGGLTAGGTREGIGGGGAGLGGDGDVIIGRPIVWEYDIVATYIGGRSWVKAKTTQGNPERREP